MLLEYKKDKAPVGWPRNANGDPTEGSVLGRLLYVNRCRADELKERRPEEGSQQRAGVENWMPHPLPSPANSKRVSGKAIGRNGKL